MDRLAERTGRPYRLFDYVGHPEAERVLILMGSGVGAAEEAVEAMIERGDRVGLVKVRLFRPFSAEALVAALPESVRGIAVLDRTKEPGAPGEPLYQDVVTSLAEETSAGRARFAGGLPRVLGGRYGLSSKEFTPAMAKAALEELAALEPVNHFTVGITDDVTRLSLPVDPDFDTEDPDVVRAVFFGLGSDGTVSANKNTIKIIGEGTDLHAQGYFVYDSKKAGGLTVSHLRFGPRPIRSTYLIRSANVVAVHQFERLERADVLSVAAEGATFLLNSPYGPDEVWEHLPEATRRHIVDKHLRMFVVDGYRVAKEAGLGTRVNTVLQTCFFAIADILPPDEAVSAIKAAIVKTYGKRGETVLTRNFAAVDGAIAALHEVTIPAEVGEGPPMLPAVSADAPDFVQRVTAAMIAGEGDLLPGERAPRRRDVPDRHRPLGEAEHRARDPGVGPGDLHRLREVRPGLPARGDPHEGVRARRGRGRPGRVQDEGLEGPRPSRAADDDPGRARRLHRLRDLRRRVPRPQQGGGQAQVDRHVPEGRAPRRRARVVRLLPDDPRPGPHRRPRRHREGLAAAPAALRVLGGVRGLRRDALPEGAHAAGRRPAAGRERHGLLVDLRRQPPDHAVGRRPRRARAGVVQLAVRGQRGVRPRDAARARREGRPGREPAGGDGARARRGPRARAPRRDDRPRRRGDRAPAAAPRPAPRPDRPRRGSADPRPAGRGGRPRPDERLDRGRRRLGLRHRVRRARPRARDRPRRERPGARHRGLLEHRRPGVEVDRPRSGRQVRGGGQVRRQEGPRDDRDRLRRRLRRPDRDGRRHAAHGEGARRGRGAPRALARDRVQPLHRARDRHVDRDEPPEGGRGLGLLAAVAVRPGGRRGRRAPVPPRQQEADDPAEGVHRPGGALRDAAAHRPRSGRHADAARAGRRRRALAPVRADRRDRARERARGEPPGGTDAREEEGEAT